MHGEYGGMGGDGMGSRDPVFSGVVAGGFEVVNKGGGLPPGIVASGRRGGSVVRHSRGGKGSRVEHVPTPLKSAELDAPALARFDREEGGFGGDPVRRYFPLSCLVEVGVERFGEGVAGKVANALGCFEFDVLDYLRDVAELGDIREARSIRML